MTGLLERLVAAYVGALTLHARRYALEWGVALVAALSIGLTAFMLVGPPLPYPKGAVVIVHEGAPARAVAFELADAHVVREPRLLALWWRIRGEGLSIQPGAYRFNGPQNLFTVAHRLSVGAYGIPSIRLTIPEGATVLDMAHKVSAELPEISLSDFISVAGPFEGYLFPDTYILQPSATAASVVAKMQQTFASKTEPLAGDIAASGHSLSDIIILASIVEREANTDADRKMVAGILWNRIDKGMPLQVDAVFGYINSRGTYSPSYHDLKVDSPYNTYSNKGLPPGPICNPGLASIEAVLHPTKSKYLFYLTGRDGLMHYATTYAGHKANLAAYLY